MNFKNFLTLVAAVFFIAVATPQIARASDPALNAISIQPYNIGSATEVYIACTSATGGVAPYTYYLQRSSDGVTYTPLTGANYTYKGAIADSSCVALYDNSATAYLGYYYKAEVIDNHGQIVYSPALYMVNSGGNYYLADGALTSGGTRVTSPGYSTVLLQLDSYSFGSAFDPTLSYWQFQYVLANADGSPGTTWTNMNGPIYWSTGITGGYLLNGLQPGSQYWVRVKMVGNTSAHYTVYSPANTFTLGAFSAGTISYSNLTMTSLSLATTGHTGGVAPFGYQWQQSADGTNFTNITGDISSIASVTGLTPNTPYWFRLKCTDTEVAGAGYVYSNVLSINTPTQLVSGTVSASNVGSTGCNLTSSVATGGLAPYAYQFQESSDGGTTWINVSATVTGLTPSTDYLFRVQTSDSSTQVVDSAAIAVTTLEQLTSGVLTDSNVTTTSVVLSESVATGGLAPYTYQYQESTDNGTTWTNLGSSAVTGLTPSTSYLFRCLTTDSQSNIVTSNILTVTTLNPLVSGVVTISNVGTTSLTLGSSVATGGLAPYTYQFQQLAGAVWQNVSSNLSGLIPGTSYTFQVVVTDSLGNTITSAPVSATTLNPLVAGSLSASDITTNSLTLSVSGATGGIPPYSIQYQENIAGVWTNISASVTGLTPGTSYTFRAVVTDSNITVAYSNSLTVTTQALLTIDIPYFDVSGINIHAVPAVNTTGTVIYQFQRANDNSGVPGPYSNIGTASTSLEYNDTTVVPGTIYWYRVVATDDSNGIPVASTGLQITIPAAAVN